MSSRSSEETDASPDAARFSAIPHAILFDCRLSRDARLLYAMMQSYWRQGGECWASHATLAAAMGCSEAQLRRYIGELLAASVIVARRRGQGQSKAYRPTSALPDVTEQPITDERFNRSLMSGSADSNRSPVIPQPLTGEHSNRSPVSTEEEAIKKKQQVDPAAADFFDRKKHPRGDDIARYVMAWVDFNVDDHGWYHGFWTPEVIRLLEDAVEAFDYDTMQRAAEWGCNLGGKPLQVVLATARRMASDPPAYGSGQAARADVDPAARRDGEDFMAWLRRQDVTPAGAMSTGWRIAG